MARYNEKYQPKIYRSDGGNTHNYDSGASIIIHPDVTVGPPAGNLWAGAPSLFKPDPSYAFQVFDDFLYQASATASDVNTWTAMNDGSTGTPAYQDIAG